MSTSLSARQQAVIPVAVFTAKGDIEKLDNALNDGLNAGLTINELKEILVQLYAYCGFPRSLNALSRLMEIVAARKKEGMQDEEGATAMPLPADWNSLQSGTENQTRLVGQPVKGALFTFAPAIDVYLKAHLFGDIFQNDVLDWQTRELVTIAALSAMEGANSQLKSHFAISMNNGLTAVQLLAFVSELTAKCGTVIAANAGMTLAQFFAEIGEESGLAM
ncbi:4-carboxymuconolactone decarboxylase [Salmonella enterica subsp. salamae]|nr:4-carboxymuconolactone decarboxylase [Salmonella enterica subsp. salamae]ECJ2282566.1 4-carboxymuconolactone decarboxylase [Salmonella enterica subsp. salamae]